MPIRAQLIAAVAAFAVAFGAGWMVNGWRHGAKLARVESAHAQLLEKQAHAVVESVQAARAIEQKRADIMESERDNAIEQTRALEIDVAASADTASRLRSELNALRARYANLNTADADRSEGEPGFDAIGVLIDMYAGLDSTGREVAQYADRLRIAGRTCEAAYDSL